MVIVVGLGNIGLPYKNTFHNVGFFVADKLAEKIGTSFKKDKYKALLAEGRFNGESVVIAKPTTLMNNSGECVAMLKKKFKDARIIVVVDDIDLKKGVIRYREKGSSGTHNGLRSIVCYIGEEFERVRVGIDRDPSKDLADYVLSNLTKEDHELIDPAVEKAVDMILEKIGWIYYKKN